MINLLHHRLTERNVNGRAGSSIEARGKFRTRPELNGTARMPNAESPGTRTSIRTVGVVVPAMTGYFMPEVLSAIETSLNDAGLIMVICQTSNNPGKESSFLQNAVANHYDGLLVSLCDSTINSDYYSNLAHCGIPVIFFDKVPSGTECSSVSIDNEEAGYMVTKHLIMQGAKKIAHLTGDLTCKKYGDRYLGYVRALGESGLPIRPELLLTGDLSEAFGIESAATLKANGADALVSSGEIAAVSCMNELKRAGISIPDDFLIACCDSASLSMFTTPSITSFENPAYELGAAAAKLMVERFQTGIENFIPKQMVLEARLQVRNSSYPAKHNV